MSFEKNPLASKKFVAFLVAEISWKVLALGGLGLALHQGKVDVVLGVLLMAVVIVAGFVEAGYIIGQASLDRYTRIAEIATQTGKNVTFRDVSVSAPGVATRPQQPPKPPTPEGGAR